MITPTHARIPFESGFLLTLVVLAVSGLLWLFWPFLPGLTLAVVLAASTYPLYRKLQAHWRLSPQPAALLMTIGVLATVVTPLIYLLTATGLRLVRQVGEVRAWSKGFTTLEELVGALRGQLELLPIPRELRELVLDYAVQHRTDLGEQTAQVLLHFFRGIGDNAVGFFSSLVLILFALFFFYRDGPAMVVRLKDLTPLPERYDDIILHHFRALATVLTATTLGIALLQGVSFGVVSALVGLPGFYLGVAMAVTSFIPVVGGVIVWGPASYYLYHLGHPGPALFLLVWGAVVNGFVVDNLLRPVLTGRLAALQPASPGGSEVKVLDHTLLTVLATLGGLLAFGILGLLFGPLMAAMAITIFDVYHLRHADWLSGD